MKSSSIRSAADGKDQILCGVKLRVRPDNEWPAVPAAMTGAEGAGTVAEWEYRNVSELLWTWRRVQHP